MYNAMKTDDRQDDYFHEDLESFVCDSTLKYIEHGRATYADGTKAKCKSIFGSKKRYDLRAGLPISTLRKINFYAAIDEILWIWQKKSNKVSELKSKIWDQWATPNEDGELTIGKSYGYQLAKEVYKNPLPEVFGDREKINRVEMLFYKLIYHPTDRRMIVNMYDDNDLDEMNLPPCAFMTMFHVDRGLLNMTLIQRSGDFLVAAHPGGWNCTQYAALLIMIANCTGYTANYFDHIVNDLHIYDRHEPQIKEIYDHSIKRSLVDNENYNKHSISIYQLNNEETTLPKRLKKALELFDSLTVLKSPSFDDKGSVDFKENSITLYNYKYELDIKNIEIAE